MARAGEAWRPVAPVLAPSADLAVEVVCRFARYVIPDTDPGPELSEALADMLRAAGRRIWLWDHEHGGRPGSTLACALVWGHRYLSARVGDGRCYRVDGGGATLLTPDDARTPAAACSRSPPSADRRTTSASPPSRSGPSPAARTELDCPRRPS